MKLTVNIRMDNAAFEDAGELSRILRDLAKTLDGRTFDSECGSTVRDINGNTVGTYQIS